MSAGLCSMEAEQEEGFSGVSLCKMGGRQRYQRAKRQERQRPGVLLGCGGGSWEPRRPAPGSQHWAADFLTLPEAIRTAGPHLEFKGAEGGEKGWEEQEELSLHRGEELERPSDSELLAASGCAILIQPAQKH